MDDALAAVDAAAAAAPGWAATPPRERAEILRRGFELMRAREEEIAATITAEMGKPLAEARGEAAYAAEFLRWFAEEAVRAEGEYAIAPSGAARVLVLAQPVGISVLVTPWNFPAAMATRKLGPALAAGCTAIVKPATETPLTTLLIVSLLEEAGAAARASIGVLTTSRPREVVADDGGRPARAQAVVHGLHRGRPRAAGAGGAQRRQRLDGARRQRAVPRPRGRGRRRRGRRRDGGEAAQRRRGVHGREPLPRARVGRRGLRGRAGGGDGARSASARAPSRAPSSAR